jgi:uroporphyrinogen decarboxylase
LAAVPPSHRDRFAAALDHREADRVPIAFGGPECSIHVDAHVRLLQHLGLAAGRTPPIMDNILQIVDPDEQLYDSFDVDALWLVPLEGPVTWSADGRSYTDEFGRAFTFGGGFYNQTGFPLAGDSDVEPARYSFPDMSQHDRAGGLAEKARRLYDAGYGLVADGAWGIYEISSSLRGPDALFMDMVLDPVSVEALAERVLEEHLIPYYTVLLEAVGPWVQMVVVGDDYGSQDKLLFSPRFFRRVYKPRLRRLVEHIRRLTSAKVYIHSDGAVSELLPDFIEIGLDGINPVQYSAAGMAPERLKAEFGRDLGFFGGGIDNEVLAYGSVLDIQRDVSRQVHALAPGGGYVFATIHNISPEVPAENIVAFFEAGRMFGRYPICPA